MAAALAGDSVIPPGGIAATGAVGTSGVASGAAPSAGLAAGEPGTGAGPAAVAPAPAPKMPSSAWLTVGP